MKQSFVLGLLLFLLVSCSKDKEPKLKDFTCNCTYVEQLGDSVLVEKSTVKRISYQSADFDCLGLGGKYIPANFGGNCSIE